MPTGRVHTNYAYRENFAPKGLKSSTMAEDLSPVGEDWHGSSLDTLAKRSLSPQETLKKRARAKFISTAVACRLADLKSPLEKSYRNSVYCAGIILQEHDQLHTHYCGNRWCLVCNRIRTARYINAYAPIVASWSDPHFVTLTSGPTVASAELRDRITDMQKTLTRNVVRGVRRYDQLDLKFVRKLEATYRPKTDLYHPHFHLVVDGREQSARILNRWLDQYPEAKSVAQNIKPMRENELIELFKYMTKLTTKGVGGERQITPVAALDVIFRAMRRRHTIRPYGFKVNQIKQGEISGEEELEDLQSSKAFKQLGRTVLWEWEQDMADWLDHDTGEGLSEYEPSRAFRKLLGYY